MELLTGDNVAFIYDNGKAIIRKLMSGDGMMTYEEFLLYRDVQIKNSIHERIVRLFYIYSGSVTGNNRLLPDLLGQLLNLDVTSITVPSACFNGIFDGTEPPYNDVDLYVRFSNDIRVYIYGNIPSVPLKELRDNEYVIFVLSDNLESNIDRKSDKHIYIT